MKILFATSNLNKAAEIRSMLPESFEILTLKDIELNGEIPETSATIEGNAIQKAEFIRDNFQLNCFADDTGLEVFSLKGAPGVKSARYAGEQRSDNDNMLLLLDNLKESNDRTARFKTVIALYIDEQLYTFEGVVNGRIIEGHRGTNGFGYDPLFEPENLGKTFAEMTLDEKNKYSHRARAFQKMIAFLKERTL